MPAPSAYGVFADMANTFYPGQNHRRSIRLKGFDYSLAGAYYITICTQGRDCLLSEIVLDELVLSAAGQMVEEVWTALPQRFGGIAPDDFVIMPNHFHGILIIHESVGAGLVPAPRATPAQDDRATTRVAPTVNRALGEIIGAFKSITTHEYLLGVRERGWPPFDRRFWQRNYYEHVIRDEAELAAIRAYIKDNPLRWAFDAENRLLQTDRSA